MAPSPIDVEAEFATLLGDLRTEVEVTHRGRIFCNRNLRMDQIELIGFDMDYTLALYQQDRLEQLTIELALNKLVESRGYPAEIKSLTYDPAYAIRGLVVDRKLGNVFKMDRHGHVGRVFHGFRLLSKDERHTDYRHSRILLSQTRYAWIDTLFGLPEAVMYITLVDYIDRNGEKQDYRQLFDDIRASVDQAHADETLKSRIKADLSAYFQRDAKLGDTLHKLRSSGKKMFVLTNSYYNYTDAVMSYLLDGARSAYPSWRNYFDFVVVGGRKPVFFNDREPFLQINLETGEADTKPVTTLTRDRVYQGGNVADFEDMTGVRGEHVLYIGDHIYGDILRLRKSHMWRTALVLQELERESGVVLRMEEQIKDLDSLDRRRRNIESEIDYQSMVLKRLQKLLEDGRAAPQLAERLGQAKKQAKTTLDSLRDRARLMREEVDSLEDSIDRAYNPHWGSMLREGNENSRFGEQCNDYADLYTSRVSNFLAYSPLRYFRAVRRPMPHEV